MKRKEKLIQILSGHRFLLRDLKAVQRLQLPEWCIAAGYVRNFVWDFLHAKIDETPLNDVDVLYYDLNDLSETTEKDYEKLLKQEIDKYNWSVKNQARMHDKNNEAQYRSVEEAMRRWPETATSIGVSLEETTDQLRIIAPQGLDDLFNLVIRKSPLFKDQDYFQRRVREKEWLSKWPLLKMEVSGNEDHFSTT
ncbi:nucleotidyltransferase family protein [Cohnella soli]|uniref:Nucleotidyltransferase family protein n=1 Tax=Cohnella soli TaxID=425005 RepID=A0ABW0I0A0_9BACL